MSWALEFTDDSWREYLALDHQQRAAVEEALFTEWLDRGPSHQRVRLVDGVLLRDAEFPFGVTVVFTVPNESTPEAWILKVKKPL